MKVSIFCILLVSAGPLLTSPPPGEESMGPFVRGSGTGVSLQVACHKPLFFPSLAKEGLGVVYPED